MKQGIKIEKKAMNSADVIILSSEWAKNSAIKDYNQPESKIHVIEFGANLNDDDMIKSNKFNNEESADTLNILFLGVEWIRKGGDIAVSTCKTLNDMGIKSKLFIVGIKKLDNAIKKLPYIEYVGFLNKNVPNQYQSLINVIQKCHCLLLPTLAECAGIAFSESSAFGLPAFSHATGGTGNYVIDGKNGYLLPLGSTGEDFAAKIAECYRSGELASMSTSARNVYEERLNWTVWQNKVEKILMTTMNNG